MEAVDTRSGDVVKVAPPPGLGSALAELGLDRALGSLRLLQLDPPQAREGWGLCGRVARVGQGASLSSARAV